MKLKLLKKDGKVFLELPKEFSNFEEVELFNLRDNFWLLTYNLDKVTKSDEKIVFTEEEFALLDKLSKIKFSLRTPEKVNSQLTEREKKLLNQLLQKKYINIFYGKKYKKTGVYNIADNVFPLLLNKSSLEKEQKSLSLDDLKKSGWAIVEGENIVKLSKEIEKSNMQQFVKGIIGFDKKLYITTLQFFLQNKDKILSLLEKEEKHVDEIAESLKLERNAALCLLKILAESGEVLEKKRDVFCKV